MVRHRCQICKEWYENSGHHFLCKDCWERKKQRLFEERLRKIENRKKEKKS